MIDNNTEIRFNGIVVELQAQRERWGDRAANFAAEIAVLKAENEMLKGRIRNLERDNNDENKSEI